MRFEMFRTRDGGMGKGRLPGQDFPTPEGWTPRIIISDQNGVRSKDGGHLVPVPDPKQPTEKIAPTSQAHTNNT